MYEMMSESKSLKNFLLDQYDKKKEMLNFVIVE